MAPHEAAITGEGEPGEYGGTFRAECGRPVRQAVPGRRCGRGSQTDWRDRQLRRVWHSMIVANTAPTVLGSKLRPV
jgi:hypothetical protein